MATLAVAAFGSVFLVATPAYAAPELTISPQGPFKGGDKVTVTLSGFSPNSPVAVGLVPQSRFPAEGPGDACASKLGCSKLTVTDAQGGLVQELTIVEGPIENSSAPAESCGPDDPCLMSASNISNPDETASVEIEFVGGGSDDPQPTASPTPSTSDSPTPAPTETRMPDTGPRETALGGLVAGAVVAQLGLVLAVRAARSRPRLAARH